VKNDAEIIEGVLAGRSDRFEALVTRYMALVRSVCASHVRQSSAHDDIVQESFVYAYTKLRSLRNRERFGPWLCAIVRNKCRNWLRSHRRAETLSQTLAEEPPPHSVSTPEDNAMREELRDWIRSHISRLPAATREAMSLCYLDGLAQKDAAAFLGVSPSALKKRLQYGRTHLSKRIWGELEHIEGKSKRDQTALSGAIMLSVNQVTLPASPGAWTLAMNFVTSKAGIYSFGAIVLLVAAGFNLPGAISTPMLIAEPVVQTEPAPGQADINREETETIALAASQIALAADTPGESIVRVATPDPTSEEAPNGITGVVVLNGTMVPVAGVQILVRDKSDTRENEWLAETVSAADGSFSFPELVPPQTNLKWKVGEPFQYRLWSSNNAYEFDENGNNTQSIRLNVLKEGAITGYVRYPDGTPVEGIWIMRQFNTVKSRGDYMTMTDEEGRFGFTHDGGLWNIYAGKPLSLRSKTKPLDLLAEENIEHDFVLPRGATIHVALDTGAEPPPAKINLIIVHHNFTSYESGEPRTSGISYAFSQSNINSATSFYQNGELVFPFAEMGEYKMEVEAKGFKRGFVGPIIIDDSFEDAHVTMKLLPKPAVELASNTDDLQSSNPNLQTQEEPPQKVRVEWRAYDDDGRPLQQSGNTFNFSVNATSGECLKHHGSTSLNPGTYWMISVKDGYTADIQLHDLTGDEYEITTVFEKSGSAYGALAAPINDEPMTYPNETVLIYPLEVWNLTDYPFEKHLLGTFSTETFIQLGEALAQGSIDEESGTFVASYLPAGTYVAHYGNRVSEPFEVQVGYETGPVVFSEKPVRNPSPNID
jgi:RNA polymerase sigma-70 factor (ECF subfamily)